MKGRSNNNVTTLHLLCQEYRGLSLFWCNLRTNILLLKLVSFTLKIMNTRVRVTHAFSLCYTFLTLQNHSFVAIYLFQERYNKGPRYCHILSHLYFFLLIFFKSVKWMRLGRNTVNRFSWNILMLKRSLSKEVCALSFLTLTPIQILGFYNGPETQ